MSLINSLWIGDRLGPLHAACLSSFVRQGHEIVLHAYGTPVDIPDGVRLFDANRLMKHSEIQTHKRTGSLALASDIYRYRIMREGLGTYVDADVYCIKPMLEDEYIFGFEEPCYLNGAVLKIPQDSALLSDILEASENPYFMPPWIKGYKRLFEEARKTLGFPRHVAGRSWGTIGPKLITHLVYKNKLEAKVQSQDVFYPVSFSQLSKFFEEGLSIRDLITPNTVAIHLFNNGIKNRPIFPNTPLHEILSQA